NDNTMGSVASGKEMDCIAHFGLNQPGEIEIQFSPILSFEKAAKFKATV
ncbi:phage immunity protein, partial [Enterococcus faecalis]